MRNWITCLYCAVEFETSSCVEEFTNCWSSKRNACVIYPVHYHNLQNKQIYWRGSWHVLVGTCKVLLWATWKLNLPWFGLKPTNTSSTFQRCIQVRKPPLSSKVCISFSATSESTMFHPPNIFLPNKPFTTEHQFVYSPYCSLYIF